MIMRGKLWDQILFDKDGGGGEGGGDVEVVDAPVDTGGNDGGDTGGGDQAADTSGNDGDSGADDLLGSGGDDDRKVVVEADWPEDWRNRMAGDNEKAMKALERYGDPSKVAQALMAAQQKISSGEYKKTVTEDSTPEEKAEALKEAGVPEKWEDYQVPDNLQMAEFGDVSEDPALQTFLGEMHEVSAAQPVVAKALEAYDKVLVRAQEQQVENDKAFKIDQEDALRAQWGEEYRPRINLYTRMMEDAEGPLPREVAQHILTARNGDGHRIVNDAKVADWLVSLGTEHYGDGALLTGEQAKATAGRKEEIERIMDTDMDAYFRDPKMQQEYQEIVEVEQRRGSR